MGQNMTRLLRILLFLAMAGLLLPASECFPLDDDDDSGDDDDATGDDDDSVAVEPVQLSGSVTVIHRDTGEVLEGDAYTAMAGALVVYIVEDVDNLYETVAKVVLDEPGDYEVEVPGDLGNVFALVICDYDWDSIISVRDVRREYAFNPIAIIEGQDVEGVNLVVDIPTHGGGGPYEGTWTTISGPINLVNIDDGPIRVTANHADYWGPIYGSTVALDQAGPYSTSVRDNLTGGVTNLLAYMDKDGNGLFEFDDWIGEANANPIILGIGDVEGVQIDIPATDALPIPVPSPYVSILGSVIYDGFAGGDIHVYATVDHISGQAFDFDLMGAPGDFALRVPAGAINVVVWAINDEDGDGDYNYASDPFGMHPMMDVGSDSVSDVVLTLVAGGAPGSISGTITWDGPVATGDVLRLGLADDPATPSPSITVNVANPNFPVNYTIHNVSPGSWWLGAFLDTDEDPEGGPTAEDPIGSFGNVLAVGPDEHLEGIDVVLAAPAK
jgi:hypothetical protein